MGKAQRHYPCCYTCGIVQPHYLMKEVFLKNKRHKGHKHYCFSCDEKYIRHLEDEAK